MFEWLKRILRNRIITTAADPVPSKAYGSYGRLEIPDLKIGVPLYASNGNNSQKIVDDRNSAAFIRWHYQEVIADHVSQSNFKNLIMAKPGVTRAHLLFADGSITTLICTQIQTGHIVITDGKNKMYDEQWAPFDKQNAGGFVIYTCKGLRKGNVQDVTLTYWSKTDE